MVTTVMPTYGRIDIAFEKGDGPYLYTADGRRYLDFAAGIATNSLGHGHPHMVKTIQEQAARLMHVSNLYNIPEQQRLADRLCETSFADTVFFCNSGAEAMEGSTKVARRYHFHHGAPHRTRIVCCNHSFHGRTLGMLSATDKEAYREGFGPRAAGFTTSLSAISMRCGRRWTTTWPPLWSNRCRVRAASMQPTSITCGRCAKSPMSSVCFDFDEIQCGMGRSGKLWAHEWAGIVPDIMATAKGLAAAFPLVRSWHRKRRQAG